MPSIVVMLEFPWFDTSTQELEDSLIPTILDSFEEGKYGISVGPESADALIFFISASRIWLSAVSLPVDGWDCVAALMSLCLGHFCLSVVLRVRRQPGLGMFANSRLAEYYVWSDASLFT